MYITLILSFKLGQACDHVLSITLIAIILPTLKFLKTSTQMIGILPSRRLFHQCSSNKEFLSHFMVTVQMYIPAQSISRSAFDLHAIEHQEEVDRDQVNNILSLQSMSCQGVLAFYRLKLNIFDVIAQILKLYTVQYKILKGENFGKLQKIRHNNLVHNFPSSKQKYSVYSRLNCASKQNSILSF